MKMLLEEKTNARAEGKDLQQESDYVARKLVTFQLKCTTNRSMLNALRKHKVHIFIFPLSIVNNLLMYLLLFLLYLLILNNSSPFDEKAGWKEGKKNWVYRRQFVALTKLISQNAQQNPSRWLFIGTTWRVYANLSLSLTQLTCGIESKAKLFSSWLTFV